MSENDFIATIIQDTKSILGKHKPTINNNIDGLYCKYCNKCFKNKNSLYKHINELRCKEIPEKEKKLILIKNTNKHVKKCVKIEKLLNSSSRTLYDKLEDEEENEDQHINDDFKNNDFKNENENKNKNKNKKVT